MSNLSNVILNMFDLIHNCFCKLSVSLKVLSLFVLCL